MVDPSEPSATISATAETIGHRIANAVFDMSDVLGQKVDDRIDHPAVTIDLVATGIADTITRSVGETPVVLPGGSYLTYTTVQVGTRTTDMVDVVALVVQTSDQGGPAVLTCRGAWLPLNARTELTLGRGYRA